MYPSQYPSQIIQMMAPNLPDETSAPCRHVRWLIAARIAWVVVLLLVIATFATGVPRQYAALYLQMSAHADNLHGISVDFIVRYMIILDAIVLVGFAGTALWVYLR